jgi:hypothetical protein
MISDYGLENHVQISTVERESLSGFDSSLENLFF